MKQILIRDAYIEMHIKVQSMFRKNLLYKSVTEWGRFVTLLSLDNNECGFNHNYSVLSIESMGNGHWALWFVAQLFIVYHLLNSYYR